MKSNAFYAIAIIATLAAAVSTGVQADEADGSQYATRFEGSRTRAEVQAEAGKVAATRSTEPAGSRVGAPMKSTVDKQALRGQTAEALRLGRIPRGEVGIL